MGSKGSATTTSTSAPPQAVQDMYKYITEQGKTLQQQPYQQYQGQLVPDINATQQAGINQAQQYSQAAQPGYQAGYGATNTAMNQIAQGQNVAQPYYGAATGLTGAAAQQVGMNMNAAQPAYQAGYGAAGQAQDILNQGLGVAQPYFQGAQTFAAGTLPQYQQAAGVAQAGMRPLMQSTYAAQPSYQAAQAGTMAAGAGTGQTIGQLGNISQGYNAPNYQAGVQGYMNPYLQNAMGSTAAMMQNQNQQQQNQLQGNAISQGAFGGDRGNIAQAALMGQQNLAMGQTLGQMANTGYQSAAQNYMSGLGQQGALAGQQGAMYGQLGNLSNQYGQLGGQAQQALINAGQAQQQGAANIANIAGQGMGAASQYGALGTAAQNAALQGMPLAQQQATLYGQLGTGAQNAAMQGAQQLGALGAQYGQLGTSAQNAALQTVPMSLAAGAQYGQLGAGAQTAGMTGAQQLSAAGAIPYAVQQAQDAAQYQQFAQQQAYPWQTLGSLANMASGLGAGQGGVSSTTTPGPNSMNSIMGLGTSLLGYLTPSDERLKENMEPIGKTFDGQNLYKYNYKGDPRTQIGLSAQEVEKRNPNAVHKTEGGMRMVNYDDATSNAANRGHFAGGGSSMGGLVPESMERHPYAYGGVGQSQRQFGETPYADDPLSEEMAALAKITLGSYIPQMKEIKPVGIGIPDYPGRYQDKPMDTSGIEGFGKAYKNYSAANAIAPSIAAQGKDISGLGTDVGSYSLGLNYANGGLVPRVPHADGSSADPEKTVPADQDFLGGLGSSISKGLGSVFGSDTQPGLVSNVFNKGQPLSDDARQAIMAAGFGMMASPSPFVAQAIGQGGLIGANTYAKQKQINYETQKALAEQALRGREIGVGEAGIPIRQSEVSNMILQTKIKQFEDWRALYRPVPDETGRVGSYVDPNGQEIPPEDFVQRQIMFLKSVGLPTEAYVGAQHRASGGRTGYATDGSVDEGDQKPIVLAQADTIKNPAETKAPSADEELPPELKQMMDMQSQIEHMNKAAPHMVYAPDVQRNTYDQIRQMREQLQTLQGREYETPTGMKYRWQYGATPTVNEPPQPLTDQAPRGQVDPDTGAIKTVPVDIGYPETKGYPVSALPKHAVKVGADPVYSEAVKQSTPIESDFLEQSQNTQEAITNLAKFASAAKVIETSALKSDKTRIAAVLQSLGFDKAATAVNGAANIGEAQVLAKSALDSAVSKVTSSFSKPTQSEFHLLESKASPNLDLQPDANFSLSSTQLGAAMWQDALRRDWLNAKSQGAQNFLAYQGLWKKQNNREMFEDSAQRLLGNYAGQELPSVDKLVSGGLYVVPPVKKGEKLGGLKSYLYNNGFTAGDVVTLPRVNHYKDDKGKMQVDFDEPTKVPDNQIYQKILSQPGFGFGG